MRLGGSEAGKLGSWEAGRLEIRVSTKLVVSSVFHLLHL